MLRAGCSSFNVGSDGANNEGATAQTALCESCGKMSCNDNRSVAFCCSGFLLAPLAGTHAFSCSTFSAVARPPRMWEWCRLMCTNKPPALTRSLVRMISADSSTASSQVISFLTPQIRSTRHNTSALTPAAAITSLILARLLCTTPRASGLCSGSKESLIVLALPSSEGTHSIPDKRRPNATMSASFHEPTHSKYATNNGANLAVSIVGAAGMRTSCKTHSHGFMVNAFLLCKYSTTCSAGSTALWPALMHKSSNCPRQALSASVGEGKYTASPGLTSSPLAAAMHFRTESADTNGLRIAWKSRSVSFSLGHAQWP
mmetsp:Transcript_55479/g.168640  ORF Transcript_55479/g.168640 Transcript_55479/m.168640 type:complete len:316 (-) Transcript_55479:1394-2341(-)